MERRVQDRQQRRAFVSGMALTLLLVVASGLGSVVLGLWTTDTAGGPSTIEVMLAGAALNASLRRHAPDVGNPLPRVSATLDSGMRVYRNNCAGCHGGPTAEPSAFGLGFYPPAPQFVSTPPRRPAGQLFYLIKHGIRRTGMTAWSSIMGDDDIWRAVAFIQRIDSLPPGLDSAWRGR